MMDSRFVRRFVKVKKGVQDLAELELARAMEECAATERAYADLVDRRRTAAEARNQARSAAEIHQWQEYIESLARMEAMQSEVLKEAQQAVEECRRGVHGAYLEVRKWESVEEKVALRANLEGQRMQLKESDESAVLRFGRSHG